MTVSELIEELNLLDPQLEVYKQFDVVDDYYGVHTDEASLSLGARTAQVADVWNKKGWTYKKVALIS